MWQGKYLNVILTVNAVLLAGLLWTQVAEQPVLAETAVAQSRSKPSADGKYKGSYYKPNAAQQRADQMKILEAIQKSVEAQTKLLSSGKVKVEVMNLDEIKIEMPTNP